MEKEKNVIDLMESFSKDQFEEVKYNASKLEGKQSFVLSLMSNPKIISLIQNPNKIKTILGFMLFTMLIGVVAIVYNIVLFFIFIFTYIL